MAINGVTIKNAEDLWTAHRKVMERRRAIYDIRRRGEEHAQVIVRLHELWQRKWSFTVDFPGEDGE